MFLTYILADFQTHLIFIGFMNTITFRQYYLDLNYLDLNYTILYSGSQLNTRKKAEIWPQAVSSTSNSLKEKVKKSLKSIIYFLVTQITCQTWSLLCDIPVFHEFCILTSHYVKFVISFFFRPVFSPLRTKSDSVLIHESAG